MKRFGILLLAVFWLSISVTAFASEPLGFPMREGSSTEAHKHNEEGILHYNKGHYEEALKHFQMASKIDSSVGASHYNEALCLDKLGRHKEATMHFGAAKKHAQGRAEIVDSAILKKHLGM